MPDPNANDFQMPEDLKGKSPEDIARLYTETRSEYDKFKGEWEPRAKQWDEWSALGSPAEIKQIVDWGKSVAPVWQKIAKGEAYLLNDADYKAYKNWADKTGNGTRQSPDHGTASPDDDLFGPVKKSLREELLTELKTEIENRAKQFDGNINRGFKTLLDQQNLFAHVMKLQKQHPNMDFDSLLKKGAEMAQMPADQLLNSLIDSESKLSGMEAEIEKRVAAALAEKEAAKQNESVKALTDNRRNAGNLPLASPKRADVMKGLVNGLNKKFPGLLEQLPLT